MHPNLPDQLQAEAQLQWQHLAETCPDHIALLQSHKQAIQPVMLASPWSVQQWLRHPDGLVSMLTQPEQFDTLATLSVMQDELHLRIQALPANLDVFAVHGLASVLRDFRNQYQVRFIWAHIHKLCSPQVLTHAVSNLADLCIDTALHYLYQQAVTTWGEPQDTQGNQQQLVVLGMGKLGGQELNLSSDIDLIFAYPKAGQTVKMALSDNASSSTNKSLDNQQFFTRLGHQLIQVLQQPTDKGFVYRVDMRLRPYGDSGALVANFNSVQLYYLEQGRDWERYALIKARVVAGDKPAGTQLLQLLKPFVYRRYLDYSAIDSLRRMKKMMQAEVRRLGLTHNIKLCQGGIREVEFIAQAYQLIKGGKSAQLQTPQLMVALTALKAEHEWQDDGIDTLIKHYWLLRNVEHSLQAVHDQQTQTLPETSNEQARIAYGLGYTDWPALSQAIAQACDAVHVYFKNIVADDTETAATDDTYRQLKCLVEDLILLDADASSGLSNTTLSNTVPRQDAPLTQQNTLDPTHTLLTTLGFAQPQKALLCLTQLLQGRTAKNMQALAQERLINSLPNLLQLCGEKQESEKILARVLVLIEAILRRSVYLVLLQENPSTTKLLVDLCAASAWFSDFLARQPSLLDELLDVHSLFARLTSQDIQKDLQLRLLRVDPQDEETFIDKLRHFKHAHILRTAAQEVTKKLPLMQVSDQLSYVAEALLQQALTWAWQSLALRYGEPIKPDGSRYGFIIVAYGKLGGLELSYGSDLDLVFIHNAPQNSMTQGSKSIENHLFFTRLGQRLIHYLSAMTPAGRAYEIDMRLRPDGAKGLLVSSLPAFEHYQTQQAWTWEHQSLVRARPVAGDAALSQAFIDLRKTVLTQQRSVTKVQAEVVAMRHKMRANITTETSHTTQPINAENHQIASANQATQSTPMTHLKHGEGGIIDIEFMVQYLVLAHAHQAPNLVTHTDNIRILEAIETAQILPSKDCHNLSQAYCSLRSLEHQQTLAEHKLNQPNTNNEPNAQTDLHKLQIYRQEVMSIWQRVMLSEK